MRILHLPRRAYRPAPTQPPLQDTRGLVVNAYTVEGAPGPFGAAHDIWFSLDITNGSDQTQAFDALGTWVEQTGQYQTSWTYSSLEPWQNLAWRDHINILVPGTYHPFLAIHFSDGVAALLSGPIVVIVE